ncbi:MAG: hypothetical protein HFJ26_09535 [Clostridia bacterium]|jgi:hypothetical protein|nr:hypothetical protein [Clostridia bacterium]
MEYVFEFILELVFEGGIEVSKNNNIPKYIRYPLIIIISLFFIAVIGLIFFVGILSLKENMLLGICFILIGLFMLIMSVIKFRKTYFSKVDKDKLI